MKRLQGLGLGSNIKRAEPISRNEEEILEVGLVWRRGSLLICFFRGFFDDESALLLLLFAMRLT